ncbi:putative bifunctional diguanylate cyclase/phosphodiesterase [Peteryoungia ipomoeae]|uniref:EAL domain-containing protein n=1 Tax=Peteryoungia ipomoeae TaxID=1210932 RepID=A0A4S8P146_9HYPH|nr:EAL domain-containing protein [Peteryoungia ipomoeae]THV23011.1 EAL domain-containing protein [Peteryoungia ipomoeae]
MLLSTQNTILEMTAKGRPIGEIVDYLCRAVEAMADDVVSSVLLLDSENRLRHLGGPSLPLHYCQAIDGTQIGPGIGSCGTAAFTGKAVEVTDIETHPYWALYKSLALPLGLMACWSTPIIASGRVLGTFAFYYRTPRGPSDLERMLVEACVHLCAIAIERDQRRAEQQRLAEIDALTGLPNRSRFNGALASVARTEPNWALVLLDVDNLKMVNDTFGHAAGDDLIRTVGHRLASVCAPGTAFRLGGDEFAIIIACAETTEPEALAAAVIDSISSPADCAGHVIFPKATLGGARADGERSPEQVRQNADYALYDAKETARGRFVEFVPGHGSAIIRRFRSVRDVDEALRDDRIDTFYQPVISLSNGRILGFEALCRMTTPEGHIIEAQQFQEAMKDAHIAIEITNRMLDRIGKDVRQWQSEALAYGTIGINLTAADFYRGGLTERIKAVCLQCGIKPESFVAEVSESVYLARKDGIVADEISLLRQEGFRVALDDFGTGFASLTQLMTVPVDMIKIERSFVQRLFQAGGGSVVTRGLLEIANGLGIDVIAEGIETPDQADQLSQLTCTAGQGYFFARPMARDQVRLLLNEGKGFHLAWKATVEQSVAERLFA